jgi:hypothetical protein
LDLRASTVAAGAAGNALCHGVVICASDYDRSCTTDSDCVGVGVGVGNPCDPCFCLTAAISKRDLGRYQSDVTAAISPE